MRSFCHLSMSTAGCFICVNNVSVFVERDSHKPWWFLWQCSLFPVWRTNRKTPNGRRSFRSNEGKQGEHDWAHFGQQSAFFLAASLGDLDFCFPFFFSLSCLKKQLCAKAFYLKNSKLHFTVLKKDLFSKKGDTWKTYFEWVGGTYTTVCLPGK